MKCAHCSSQNYDFLHFHECHDCRIEECDCSLMVFKLSEYVVEMKQRETLKGVKVRQL